MADNPTLPATGEAVRTDDDGTAHWQYVKLAFGADNTQNIVTSTTVNPIPVVTPDPGTTASDLAKAVDGASSGSDVGIASLAVRDDALTTLTPVDGDYTTFRVDSTGALWTAVSSSALPTGAATSALQTTGNSSLSTIAGDTTSLDSKITACNTAAIAGTVTANLSATDNAVLDSIDTNTGTIAGAVAGTEMQVDIVTSALPTGAATETTLAAVETDTTTLVTLSGTIATNTGTAAAGYATEGSALGSGVLLQGDDGTDRKNINVDATTGDVQVDVTNTVTVDGSGVTQPISASSLPLPSLAATSTNQAVVIARLDNVDTNTDYGQVVGGGTEATALRVTIASDSTGVVSVDDNGGSLTVDGSVSLAAAIPAGTNNIGDVDIASAIPAGTNVIGDVGISGARTSGGTTMYRNIDVDETEDAVKATAGQVYWIHCVTIDATPVYLHFYNATVATVTVGTTTPDLTFLVPSQGDANGAGFVLSVSNGIEFDTAITVAATTAVGGTGAPGTNEVILNLGYA